MWVAPWSWLVVPALAFGPVYVEPLRGVNLPPTKGESGTCAFAPGVFKLDYSTADVASIHNYGLDAVRLMFNVDTAKNATAVAKLMSYLTAAGRGILCFMGTDPNGGHGTGLIDNLQEAAAAFRSIRESVEAAEVSTAEVFYELLNEPFGYGNDVERYMHDMLWIIQAAELPPTRCVLDGLGYAMDVQLLGRHWDGLLGYHFYNWWLGGTPTAEDYKKVFKEAVAGVSTRTLVTEFGANLWAPEGYNQYVSQNTVDVASIRGMKDAVLELEAQGEGMLGLFFWHGWNNGDSYDLWATQNTGGAELVMTIMQAMKSKRLMPTFEGVDLMGTRRGSRRSAFMKLLCMVGFLAAAWFASKLSRPLWLPPLVLEIGVGILLGPGVAGLVGQEYAVCEMRKFPTCNNAHRRIAPRIPFGPQLGAMIDSVSYCNDWSLGRCQSDQCAFQSYEDCLQQTCIAEFAQTCGANPGLFTLVGHAGVGLVLFETGTHFQLFHQKSWHGSLVAFAGALLPFLTGMGLMALYGQPLVPDGVLVGTALVPSGCAFLLQHLQKEMLLDSTLGQTVAATTLADQLLTLLLFDIFFSLGGNFDFLPMVGNPIIGVCLTCFVVWTAQPAGRLLPRFLPRLAQLLQVSYEELLYFLMFGWLVFCAWIFHLLGAFVWGCFLAGITFAHLEELETVRLAWELRTKRLTRWLLRIFYSCAVAFTIHPEVMFSGTSFWQGTVMAIFQGVLFKALPGHLGGFALVGRGELAFFVIHAAAVSGTISQRSYSIVIWALVWTAILGPLLFRLTSRQQVSALARELTEGVAENENKEPHLDCLAEIRIEGCNEEPVLDMDTKQRREEARRFLSCHPRLLGCLGLAWPREAQEESAW